MNRAVYALASGGIAAQARLDAVTQNLANVGTAGYKAGRPVFRLRPLDVEEAGLPVPPALRAAAQVTEAETVRDFSQGPVHTTGNPLDLAVSGDGFFVVATPRGERYTRQGGFGLDGEGYLVTEHGDRVQGDNGDLRLGSGDVAIGDDGQISVDGLRSLGARNESIASSGRRRWSPMLIDRSSIVPGKLPIPASTMG